VNDRTRNAVLHQMAAMGESLFEIGLKDEVSNLMLNRVWGTGQVLEHLPWLKAMNARGRHIYIRPAREHGLVMIDDLNEKQVARLSHDNLAPSCVVETSPANFQVWLRFSSGVIEPQVRTFLARTFAERYEGDTSSADFRRFGRLSGFTNPKPSRRLPSGHQPFVLLRSSNGVVVRNSAYWLHHATEHLSKLDEGAMRQQVIERIKRVNERSPYNNDDPFETYNHLANLVLNRYGGMTDYSRLDWMVAVSMAGSGRFSSHEIELAIRSCSPNIDQRKARGANQYARHTAEKAFAHAYRSNMMPARGG
jgi:hypothetical protein